MDSAVERAVEVLRRGGVIAYPTDTLYALGVDPRIGDAVARLFEVKGRDHAQAVPLIAADEEQVRQVAELSPLGERLARRFWPGPLTLVVLARAPLASGVRSPDGSVAVRVPRHDVSRDLAAGLGFCITATSANVSGHPPAAAAAAVQQALGDRIDLVLAGDAPGGPPSTIVDVRGEVPRLVRAGVVPFDRVLESLW